MTLLLTKDIVRQQLENLPDNFTLEDLIERMLLIAKIEAAENQVENNETLTEEEVNKEIQSWFK